MSTPAPTPREPTMTAEELDRIERLYKAAWDRPSGEGPTYFGPSDQLLLCRAALWGNAPALIVLAREALAGRENTEALRAACRETLAVVDDCYAATGHLRVAKTSEQRLKIEAALASQERTGGK